MLTILPLNFNNTKSHLKISRKEPSSIKEGSFDRFCWSPTGVSFLGLDAGTDTVGWYNRNAQNYFDETIGRSMEDYYPKFLKYLSQGADILDAGCGSGRDSKAFIDKGYKVTAFDASSEMTKLASRATGLDVITATFENFKSNKLFDGIWACTSLLHVPKKDFENSLSNLTDHLNLGGVLFAYLKEGQNEEVDSKGRFFSYFKVDELKQIFAKKKDVELVNISDINNTFRSGDHPFIEFVLKRIK